MKTVHVIGTGKIGKQIVMELADDGYNVKAYDILPKPEIFKKVENITYTKVKLSPKKLDEFFTAGDFVVLAVPGSVSYEYLEQLINLGVNVVDVTFMPEDPTPLKKLAKEKGVSVVVDFGVAPGMCGAIVGYENAKNAYIEEVEILVGGIPKTPRAPHYYFSTFSPSDVVEEYLRPARRVVNFEEEEIYMPVVYWDPYSDGLGCFVTDGLRTMIKSFKHIPHMAEYTIRPIGHLQFMEDLFKGGFFDDEESTENTRKVLIKNWSKQKGDEDVTIMDVNILYDDHQVMWKYMDVERDGVSSMAKVTACSTAAVMNLMLTGELKKEFYLPEDIGAKHFDDVLTYLDGKGVIFERDESEIFED